MVAQNVMLQAADMLFPSPSGSAPGSKNSGTGFELLIGREMGNIKGRFENAGSFRGISAFKAAAEKNNAPIAADKKPSGAVDKTGICKAAGKTASFKAADKGRIRKTGRENQYNTGIAGMTDKGKAGIDASRISALLSAVQEAVMKELKLTQEDFAQLISDAGITQADLLDAEKLKQLFLTLSGNADPMQLLTDEELKNGLDKLLAAVENAVDASGLNLSPEQLNRLLSELMQADAGNLAGTVNDTPLSAGSENGADTEHTGSVDKTGATGAEYEASLAGTKAGMGEEAAGGAGLQATDSTVTKTNLKLPQDNGPYTGHAGDAAADADALAGIDDAAEADGDDKVMQEENMAKDKDLPADETSPDGKLKSLDAGTSPEGGKRSGNKELSGRDSERHSFEQSIDFGQNGLFDRLAGTRTVSTADISNASDMIRLKMIVNQIVDQIRLSVTKDNASLQMALHPDWLGKVSLTVESKEGAMTARFVVSNETAKEAIESNIQVLKDTLSEQGLKVEDIEVTVAANGFDSEDSTGREGQAAQQKRSRGQRLAADGNAISSWEPEVEVGNADIDPALGSNIDMTA